MKKNIKKLVLIALIFSAFLLWIPNAKAAGEHEFSFRAYKCGEIDFEADPETEEICMGPEGDYETPEYDYDNLVVNPGDIIKLAVHYKPGTDTFWMISAFFFYNPDLVGAVYDQDNLLLYKQTGTEFTPGNVGPYPPSGTSTSAKKKTRWTVGINDAKHANEIASVMEDESTTLDTRKYLEQEGNLYYIYFQVKDDATPGATIDFTYDMNQGKTKIANNAPVTNQDISFTVYEEQSDDNTLTTLTVKNGSTNYTLTPEFVPGSKVNKTFTTYVPNNITSVNIAATPNEEHGIVSGTGTKSNLQVGNNSYQINVLSQSGLTEIYTVNVYRLSNDNTLSALALSNVNFGTFNKNTTNYTATVPYTTDKTNVTATATDGSKATITGTGNNKPLSVGENTISVTVSPENCKSEYSSVPDNTCTTKTYTVTVTREAASTVSTLNDLLVDNTRVKGFTPGDGTSTYTLDEVGYSKSSINITYVKGEDHETVSGDGTKNLSVGMNTFDVVVTAQDGTTKTTYTIKVYRKSNNANLSALNVTSSKGGTLTPNFGANTTAYTYSVDADETDVDITYTKAHDGATIATTPASLTNINPRTTSSVTIEVTPEDTTQAKKTYTITFDVAKSSNANLNDLKVDGTTVENFDKDTTIYNITVPSDKDSVNIAATAEDDRVKSISNTGSNSLNYGENQIKVTVTAEDNSTKEYTLNITREKKNISTLSDLKVDGTTVPGFNKDTLTYTLDDVAYSKSSVNITYTTSDSDATVTGNGTKNLSVGDNALKVTVTAQNGTDKTEYTINIHRKSNDATLKSLNVISSKTGTLSPAFNANTTAYTYSVDADETEVTVSGEKNHDLATVTGGATVNPRTTSYVELTVTSENGDINVYRVTFDVAKSSNKDLSEITIDTEPIPGFDPNTTSYTIDVPSDKESVNVGATPADDRSDVDGTGTKPLDYGENEVTITVTAEDGTEKEYTVIINRAKKTNADLADLKADNVTVPNFHSGDPDGTEYDLGDVASNKTTVNITATPADSDATVTGTGVKNLAVGDNRFPIEVTAQDGTTKKTYYVKVKRLNDSKNLETLTITSDPAGTLDKPFDPEETTYTYTTDPDETEVIISATVPEGSGSTITSGPGTYNPATTSEVTIVVKAEDNTEKHYIVNLERAKSTNNKLSDIKVDGDTIDGFNPDTTEYTITVPSDKETIDIAATLADDRAEKTGDGEKTLSYGDNQFTITVTPEDPNGEPKVYTINVTRELKNNANFADLKADGITVPNFKTTDPDGTVYDLGKVNSDKETIEITATPADSDATVTGVGTKGLNIGDNTFDVTVTAQDGTTKKTYTIKVRRRNNDSSLTNLEVVADTDGTLSPSFNPDVTEYTYTSDPDEDEVTINVTLPDGATVSGIEDPFNPQNGEDAVILVTAEDGTITTYIVHVERGKATNADLDELDVVGYTLSPDFDKDETEYNVTVPADVDSVVITAHAADAPRANVEGTGSKDVNSGANRFPVTVTADDGTTTKTYYVNVTRELSDDTKLSDLKVNGTTIDGFDPDEVLYDYGTVGNDVTSLEVVGIPENPRATVEVEGASDLQVGDNTITITVTAEDGQSTGQYIITVNREGSSNNDLSSLEVEGYDLDPDFDKDETSYSITVPSDVDSITVNAEAEDDNATVEIEGADNLQPGENTVTVKVTAENGDEKVYTITVTKEEEPEDDEKITSQVRIIADGMIKDVVYKTLPEGLKDQCDNDNDKLFIYDMEDENEIDNNQQLGTGMIIKLIKNNRVNDSDIIVVKGEVTGDGEVRINDVVRAVSAYVGAEELTGPWFEACDIATDGEIRINDVVSIVNLYVSE